MIGIVVTGHGNFPSGLAQATEMIAGSQKAFEVVGLQERESLESLESRLNEAVKGVCGSDGCVIFADLMGGSPSKEALDIAANHDNIEVVVGVNLPILIEATLARQFMNSPQELAKLAIQSGQAAIAYMKEIINRQSPVAFSLADD